MWEKLAEIERQLEQIQADLQKPEIVSDLKNLEHLGRRNAELEPVVAAFRKAERVKKEIAESEELLHDAEMHDAAQEELAKLKPELIKIEEELKVMLLPRDPNDDKSVLIEINPGTGGEEAALFAADLLRMYTRFAEREGWKADLIEMQETGIGGISSATLSIDAHGAYSKLKHETGIHRVQRVPKTESSGRLHTSAASVAVLPEAEEVDIEIRPEDLEIDTYRASGAGGQHVNKTESAIRIKHKESGIIVSCQDERSQVQNRARAMKVLRAKLYERQMEELAKEQQVVRLAGFGSGDRSAKIRTYNFPQSRITDHRIGFTIHNLQEALDGDIGQLIEALTQHEQATLLASHD